MTTATSRSGPTSTVHVRHALKAVIGLAREAGLDGCTQKLREAMAEIDAADARRAMPDGGPGSGEG